jgi:hypothetical protein
MPARWIVCFLALPAVWIAWSLETGLQAVLMIPAAAVIALLSALTAYRSGCGKRGAFGYFLGTSAMMGVAFAIAVATIFTVYCDRGETEGAC